jgi:UDP-2,3-diacylglucosamine hydrolase
LGEYLYISSLRYKRNTSYLDAMRAVFIADAHLRSEDSPRYAALMGFLGCLRGKAGGSERGERHDRATGRAGEASILHIERLYILGDFFDFWFQRSDRVYPGFSPVIERLAALRDQGVRISLCEGNHDFFLENYFSRVLGMTVFAEWADFEMDGRRILVSHGDTIDETNRTYLLMRNFLRSSFFHRIQAMLPLSLLWKVARAGSAISKDYSRVPPESLYRKMQVFSGEKFRQGYDAVILGHCHIPMLEEQVVGGRKKTFVTLGDWIDHCTYLTYSDGRFTLCRYRGANGGCEEYRNEQKRDGGA